MPSAYTRLIAVAVFAIGMWVALAVYLVASAKPMTAPDWEFALETYAFAALAAAVGFAIVACRSALRALFAVPVAVVLTLLIPRGLGIWLSQSFHSVGLNIVVAGLIFAIAGAAAGWLVASLFKLAERHT